MLVNKIDGCSSVIFLNKYLPASSENKKLYHLGLTYANTDYVQEVNKFIVGKYDVDGIILDCTAEGPEKSKIKQLLTMLNDSGYVNDKIFYIDSGFDYFDFCNHAIAPDWIASCDNIEILKEENSLHTRTSLFLILARIPKYQRLQFIIKMIERGLDKDSIISCGSNEIHMAEGVYDCQLFDKFVPKKFRYLFPIMPNNQRVSRHIASTNIDPEFKNCLINVVLESNYENDLYDKDGLLPVHSWNRFFYTEKTDKAFYMEQIPLFLAKAGYVAEIRKHGFDLFDDIVDHSYDNIADPFKRIEILTDECTRLHSIGLSNIIRTKNLSERLSYNKQLPKKIRNTYFTEFKNKLTDWASSL